MEALVLCYFNSQQGPTITHVLNFVRANTQTRLPPKVRAELEKLIDTQSAEQFFTYGFKTYTTANLYFEVPSVLARGGQEILCLSVLTRSGTPESFKETLIGGANRLKAIPNIYKAFHDEEKTMDKDVGQKQRELKEFLASLCQEVLRAREKAITQASARERKRNWVRDRKRDRDRDEIRDRDRDETRDKGRDKIRDKGRDETRDQAQDKICDPGLK